MTTAGQFNVEEPVTVNRKLAETVAGVPAESLTSKVNWKVPVAVGVPETVALGLPLVKERPAGGVEEGLAVSAWDILSGKAEVQLAY